MQPVYATPIEYAQWLNPSNPGTPPAGAERALRAASGRVDELLIASVYAVDSDGKPTDPDMAEALMEATCAQADYQAAIGDKNSTGAAGLWGAVKLGSASMSRGNTAGGVTKTPSKYSSEAYSILQRAGLVPKEPWVC